MRNGTARNGFGYFRARFPDNSWSLAETIIHEFQHSKLYALLDLVPLHEMNPEARHFAPWRQDPRPVPGLLQGVYSFIAVTEFWRKRIGIAAGGHRRLANFEFARWRLQVIDAIDALLESGRLSSAGAQFVKTMRATAMEWHDVEVPAEDDRLAQRVVVENRIVWRLANIHPDPAEIRELADSWLAGEQCPLDPAAVSTTLAYDGIRRRFERVRLLQTRLSDPAAFEELCASATARAAADFAGITDADLAYVRDDFSMAARFYADQLESHCEDYESWAGLALSLESHEALTQWPEIVHAIHHQVREAEPRVLASWLRR
ncbi:aKG-HExxH-type peptide beta-hydroxylase [Nonomuraea fuscirosea]|uniref:aKG-HExxH-type peptide beta-hydroxylase n=1 Tax=Nonomuraea fuscirosea TaxID=1291556 RepID=UPI003490F59B